MDCDIVLLYGSQTGNAEDLAKRIGTMAINLGLNVLVQPMDDFPLKMMTRVKIILFVCSTTGYGQEPENMKLTYNFLRRRDLPSDCLKSLKFIVLGLGSSSYVKFNWVAKILFRRLIACGANPIQDLVLGDEQHQYGCDGTIYPELEKIWITILQLLDKKPIKQEIHHKRVDSLYHVEYCDGELTLNQVYGQSFKDHYRTMEGQTISNERITSCNHFQDTRLLRFKVSDESKLLFEPGDVCTIFPANSDDITNDFIKMINLDPTRKIEISKRHKKFMTNYFYDFIPKGCTIYDCVKYFLDIQSVPKRSFFEYLWPFSNDKLEKDKLKEFASTDGQEDMFDYCVLPKRSILEVLADFPSARENIELSFIFDLIPPIKPRSFSIASSPYVYPQEIHLLVGVVRYKTSLKKMREGLCSNYLARLEPYNSSSHITFLIHKTNFKLPLDNNKPIIMVGPGLGLAPFRSFLQDRIEVNSSSKNYLYFGCRNFDTDYYFYNELSRYVDSSKLKLKVAFSRATPSQHVQDLLREDANSIQRLIIEQAANFYIAGNSKLPESLRKLLNDLFPEDKHGKLLTKLESQGRIQYDCW